jgi:hypothetical protein
MAIVEHIIVPNDEPPLFLFVLSLLLVNDHLLELLPLRLFLPLLPFLDLRLQLLFIVINIIIVVMAFFIIL